MPKQEQRQRHTQPTCPVGRLLDGHRIRLALGSMEVIREINKRGKLTYTHTSWPKWMTGTIPRHDARRLLGDVLEIPRTAFADAVAEQEQERDAFATANLTREAEPAVPYSDALAVPDGLAAVGDGEFISIPVRTTAGVIALVITRRAFLANLAVTMPGLAVPALSGTAGLAQPINRLTDLADVFMKAASVERSPAEHFLMMRRTLADSDNLPGPRQVVPIAASHMEAIEQTRRTLRGSDLHALLLVQVQFADLLGWLHQDSRDFGTSRYWLGRALETAHLVANNESMAFVLARKSQLAADMRDAATAIEVAEATMRLANAGGRTTTYAAHGHALAGDRATCERYYEHAQSLLDRVNKDGSPLGRFFGIEALCVGFQTNSTRIFTELTTLNEILAPWNSLQDVARFRDAMRAPVVRSFAGHTGSR